MIDLRPYQGVAYGIRDFRSRMEQERDIPPSARDAALKALEVLEREIIFRVEDVQWRNHYYTNTIEAVIRYGFGYDRWRGRPEDQNLGFGIGYKEYAREGRAGFVIAVWDIYEPLRRFGLHNPDPLLPSDPSVARLIEKFTREPVGRKGRTRPRMYSGVEDVRDAILQVLLDLKLLTPICGIENMHEQYDYNQ